MHGLILLAPATCLPPSYLLLGPHVGRQVGRRWDSPHMPSGKADLVMELKKVGSAANPVAGPCSEGKEQRERFGGW